MKWISHRGDLRRSTENTLKAFDQALEYRVNMIETDLRLSQDNVWMICHDRTLTREFKKEEIVNQLHSTELKRMGLITLNNILNHLKGRTQLYLDIKERSTNNLQDLTNLLYSHINQPNSPWSWDHFYLASFNSKAVKKLLSIRSQYKTYNYKVGKITSSDLDATDWSQYSNLDLISSCSAFLDQDEINKVKRKYPQIEIYVFVLNDLTMLRIFNKYPVDGLLTDYPDLFQKI